MKKFGFTLAEFLITLLVIGVVAALVLPMFMTKIEKDRTLVVFKKAYSDLGNYIKMYDYEKNCDGDTLSCVPPVTTDAPFASSFAVYLTQNHRFTNHSTKKNGYNTYFFCNPGGTRYSYLFAYPNPVSSSASSYLLVSPSGAYAYFITHYTYDNYYYPSRNNETKKMLGSFRTRIYIITNLKNLKASVDCGVGKAGMQMGKDAFEVFVTSKEKIIPQGFPECHNSTSYWCSPISESALTSKKNPGAPSTYRIIKDGFKIKYDF